MNLFHINKDFFDLNTKKPGPTRLVSLRKTPFGGLLPKIKHCLYIVSNRERERERERHLLLLLHTHTLIIINLLVLK